MGSCGNSMKLAPLPKGYRFRPTDEELLSHYLRLKINGRHSEVYVIPEVDVCKWEPWDLPALSVIKSEDPEWFFFCPRDKKYPNGHRSNRATEAGYWKATGKDRTIKSRKGHSDSHLIGMKKTLVFHRGRAPKGERTNWIMHEYRATEPDLDGTGPGQVDYVLCRLFHKADEKLDLLKYDEADHTELYPSTYKLSPDDVSSDLFREPAMLDMLMLKEPENVKKWFTDEADCMTPTNPAPVESCASDGLDHSGEESAMEVYVSKEATYNQFEDKVLGCLLSHSYSDLGGRLGSPFADDFGCEQNGLTFQDGASEQDTSLSELLEGLQNHVNNFGEESTSLRTIFGASEVSNAGYIDGLKQKPSVMFEVNDCKFHRETDKRMVQPQGQVSPTHFKIDDTSVSEARIKIQSREPRNQSSSTTQGTAPRRMRLWMGCGPKSVHEISSKDEKHEPQSLKTKVTSDIDRTSKPQESEGRSPNENEESAKKCNSRLAVKHRRDGIEKMRSFTLSAAFRVRPGSNSVKRYAAVGIYLVMTVLVFFLGLWMSQVPVCILCIIDM
ncbi:hypothetical protein OROGR_010454 [Orobanche gracilis]